MAEHDGLLDEAGDESTWAPITTSTPTSASTPAGPATRRRLRLGSLVMGVIFILIGLGGLTVDNSTDVDLLVDVDFQISE